MLVPATALSGARRQPLWGSLRGRSAEVRSAPRLTGWTAARRTGDLIKFGGVSPKGEEAVEILDQVEQIALQYEEAVDVSV